MLSRFAPEVVAPPPPELPSDDGKRYLLDATSLPRRGASGFARVTVVECGDFDCPYCARVRKTIDRLLGEYPTQVAFHFAHMPLPFHAGALLLWTVLFPSYPEVGVFSMVMHTFFVVFNALIGLLFLPRANRELFGATSPGPA